MIDPRVHTAALLLAAASLQGCAAPLALPIIASVTGGAVQAGTQATLAGGVVSRTFTIPADQVLAGVRTALQRMDITITTDAVDGDRRKLSAEPGDRIIHITVERVTSAVTRIGVVVYHGIITKDVAPASEIVAQTELALKVGGSASR